MAAHLERPRTRLYIDTPLSMGMDIVLEDKQAHYLAQVLRLSVGDAISVFNGKDGEYIATLTAVSKKQVSATLTVFLAPQTSCPDIWLLSAPLKHGKTEFVIEKATELGIAACMPVLTRFTVVHRTNTERLQTIAVEAAEQCERLDIPTIHALQPLETLLATWDKERILIYADESGASDNAADILPTIIHKKLAVLIGPEGGFSPEELALLRNLPYAKGMCMGARILRADTATIAALTLIQSYLGDWSHKPAFRSQS
jgi:16S rRNA (uracil1498-N3)-methyltransferase